MTFPGLVCRAVVLGAAVLVLAGCGVPPEQASPADSPQNNRSRAQSLLFSLLRRLESAPVYADHATSWMDSTSKKQNLLYLSDSGANEVLTYSFPAGNAVGKLTNLGDPTGVCADASGNVWVVNSNTLKIVEYAHGGTTSIATLTESGTVNPLGCSVDPKTGNLAVANLGNWRIKGSLSIFADAKGSGQKYSASNLTNAYFCGYDDEGNLFVDGLNSAYDFVLLELPSGGGTLQMVNLSATVNFPGGVAWDGEYMAIGDQEYSGEHTSAIEQFSVSGSAGTLEGKTPLTGSCDSLQFAISSGGSPRKKDGQGNTVVAPDGCLNNAAFYAYPAGGSPTQTITGLTYPVAATVSLAQ
jgi:hypothetical protein